MKQTITEIFIEVEEFICVKSATRKKATEAETDLKPVIEICPYCHRAILESTVVEIEGEEI